MKYIFNYYEGNYTKGFQRPYNFHVFCHVYLSYGCLLLQNLTTSGQNNNFRGILILFPRTEVSRESLEYSYTSRLYWLNSPAYCQAGCFLGGIGGCTWHLGPRIPFRSLFGRGASSLDRSVHMGSQTDRNNLQGYGAKEQLYFIFPSFRCETVTNCLPLREKYGRHSALFS